MGEFGSKYSYSKPTKDHWNHPIPMETFNRQLEKNDIIKNLVDEILLNETHKVSAAREAPENLDYDCDKNDIYQVEKLNLEETKEKIE